MHHQDHGPMRSLFLDDIPGKPSIMQELVQPSAFMINLPSEQSTMRKYTDLAPTLSRGILIGIRPPRGTSSPLRRMEMTSGGRNEHFKILSPSTRQIYLNHSLLLISSKLRGSTANRWECRRVAFWQAAAVHRWAIPPWARTLTFLIGMWTPRWAKQTNGVDSVPGLRSQRRASTWLRRKRATSATGAEMFNNLIHYFYFNKIFPSWEFTGQHIA